MLSGLTSTTMMPSAAPTDDMGADAAALTVSSVGRPSRRHPWLFAGMIALCLSFGLVFGWLLTPAPTVAVPSPDNLSEAKSEEPPLAIKELFFADDREKDLARKVQDHLKAPLERGLGLDLVMELGAGYVRDRKLDEADAFFKELTRNDRRVIPQYRILGDLGLAMVFAFRDQPYTSNRIFVEALEQVQKKETSGPLILGKGVDAKVGKASPKLFGDFFRQNVAWHEQMAHAINRNVVNAPDSFPTNARLQEYRKSPIAAVKAPYATP
jgi:hypothetical protein